MMLVQYPECPLKFVLVFMSLVEGNFHSLGLCVYNVDTCLVDVLLNVVLFTMTLMDVWSVWVHFVC